MKRLNSMSGVDLSIKPYSSTKRADWLIKILGLSGAALPRIREKVGVMRQEYALQYRGRSKQDLSYGLSSRLIKQSAFKVGAVGGITAVPATLPVIGTLGSAMVVITADLAYLIRKQIELCYSISAAYDTTIHEEELKAITLAILGFSGTGQMVKEIAATTLRSIVDATKSSYLQKGVTEAAAEVAAKITPRFLGKAYKLIPLLGIPLSASINIASTMMVGNQARKYFSIWEESVINIHPKRLELRIED